LEILIDKGYLLGIPYMQNFKRSKQKMEEAQYMKSQWFLILVAVLAIGLTANLAMAKTGGIKVSETSVSCGDPGKEDNQLSSGGSAEIWLNFKGGQSLTDWYTISCNDGTSVDCTEADFTDCLTEDPGYAYFDFTTPSTSGKNTSCTLKLYTDSGCVNNVSGDSWIQN
jgi:hypothetical protein